MINKKICMVGAFSVGKSSLIQQYVHSIFSDNYLSTIGVKISKKSLTIDGQDVSIMLWDLEGKDDFTDFNLAHMRGASGFFTVVDGTRPETLDMALLLRSRVLDAIGNVPHYLLFNKADLMETWTITPDQFTHLQEQGIPYFETSAKTGLGVDMAFSSLARDMLQEKP